MPKKVLINFPPLMLEQMDKVAKLEHRTRNDLVREAMRRYLNITNDPVTPKKRKETVT